jgi:hypothetical protein
MAGRGRTNPQIDQELGRHPALAKETPQEFRRFLSQNSLFHLHLVVKLRVIENRKH